MPSGRMIVVTALIALATIAIVWRVPAVKQIVTGQAA